MNQFPVSSFPLRVDCLSGRNSKLAAALTATLLLAPAAVQAQLLSDPTRPPADYATGAAGPDADAGATLQSVMISPTHRAAIISGVLVRQGERFGDAVLVKVAESEVVLKGSGGVQVLRLYPGVDMRETGPAAEKGARRADRARAGRGPDRGVAK